MWQSWYETRGQSQLDQGNNMRQSQYKKGGEGRAEAEPGLLPRAQAECLELIFSNTIEKSLPARRTAGGGRRAKAAVIVCAGGRGRSALAAALFPKQAAEGSRPMHEFRRLVPQRTAWMS